MDLLDVVDAQDRVIGQLPKDEVHARWLRHRFVHVLVANSAGEVVLQVRASTKKLGAGLYDASVGGHVDAGEDYATAVRREASEELGLPENVVLVELGEITDETPGVENMVGRLYLARYDGVFIGWETEADRLEWFTRAELWALRTNSPHLLTQGLVASIDLMEKTRPSA